MSRYIDIYDIENQQVGFNATPSQYDDTEEEINDEDYDYDGLTAWEEDNE